MIPVVPTPRSNVTAQGGGHTAHRGDGQAGGTEGGRQGSFGVPRGGDRHAPSTGGIASKATRRGAEGGRGRRGGGLRRGGLRQPQAEVVGPPVDGVHGVVRHGGRRRC